MNVILYLLTLSLTIGGAGLFAFLWTLRSGQYEDMEGAANRILFDDAEASPRRCRSALMCDESVGARAGDGFFDQPRSGND